jgi:histone deacetylase complex regulatory component SIN3
MSSTSSQASLKSSRALSLLSSIKLSTNEHTHKQFLQVLSSFRQQLLTPQQVHQQVSEILINYPQLLHEFRQFLPRDKITNEPFKLDETKPLKQDQPTTFSDGIFT